MSDKLKFWASVTLFAAIGAVTLLNQSNQHERAASREVVIDMPSPLVAPHCAWQDAPIVAPAPPGFVSHWDGKC